MNKRDRFDCLLSHVKDWASNAPMSDIRVKGLTIKAIGDKVEAAALVKRAGRLITLKWECGANGVVAFKGAER